MRRDTKTINPDVPLPDESNELYDGDVEDLEESILDEDNASDEDGEEEVPDREQEEPPTESTPQTSVTEHNTVFRDHSDVKLITEISAKVDDVRGRCSNSLLPCLVQIECKLRNEERRLRKEVRKTDGILKEALTENIGESDERDDVVRSRKSEKPDRAIVEESSGPNESDELDVVIAVKTHIVQKNLDNQHVEQQGDDDRIAFDILHCFDQHTTRGVF